MNTENDILIAKFMGFEIACADTSEPCIMGMQNAWTPMKYHSSWDWLMPVVEKIENDSIYKIRIEGSVVSINNTDILHSFGGDFFKTSNSKIEALYNAVIEFIKWYNENAAKKE